MTLSRPIRRAFWILLAVWAGASGCTHNYYYTTPNCAPSGEVVTTQIGSACDVPSGQVVAGSTAPGVVVQSPARRSAFSSPAGSSQVVISQPNYYAQGGRGANRLGWRRPDPDSPAITRVEGALDSGTVSR